MTDADLLRRMAASDAAVFGPGHTEREAAFRAGAAALERLPGAERERDEWHRRAEEAGKDAAAAVQQRAKAEAELAEARAEAGRRTREVGLCGGLQARLRAALDAMTRSRDEWKLRAVEAEKTVAALTWQVGCLSGRPGENP